MNKVSFGHLTDVGCKRDYNEDCLACLPEIGLWVVADGMGGYDAGEVASALAVDTITGEVQKGESLKDAILSAHQKILEAVTQGRGSKGMGTTVIALKLSGLKYEIAWVGDSRAYLFSKKLFQVSRDHSFVQYMLDKGAITPKEAKDHPRSNEITQALGSAPDSGPKVDTVKGSFFKGEKLLLCSDGLYGEVDDKTIQTILKSKNSDQDKAAKLIEEARKNGGSDNITAILVSAPENAPAHSILKRGDTMPFNTSAFNRMVLRRRFVKFGAVILVLACVAAAAWFAWGHWFVNE